MSAILGIQITPKRIHWAAVAGSPEAPRLSNPELNNPLSLPLGETDGAQYTRLLADISTLLDAVKPAVIVSLPYSTMHPDKDDCMSLGALRVCFMMAASRANVRFEETTLANANKKLLKKKFDQSALYEFVRNRFPVSSEQQTKCVALAWSRLP